MCTVSLWEREAEVPTYKRGYEAHDGSFNYEDEPHPLALPSPLDLSPSHRPPFDPIDPRPSQPWRALTERRSEDARVPPAEHRSIAASSGR